MSFRRPGVGLGRRRGFRGVGGGGSAPSFSAPVISGAVAVGNSPTLVNAGGYSTFALYRDAVLVGGATEDLDAAGVAAYVYVAADCADVDVTWEGYVGAGNAGTGTQSNALAYYPTTHFRDVYDAALGITLAGSDVDEWASQGSAGNNLAAPSSSARPLLVVSDAGFGGEPAITFDGSTEYLTKAAYANGAALTKISCFQVMRIDTSTPNRAWMQYGGTPYFRMVQTGADALARLSLYTTSPTVVSLGTTLYGVGTAVLCGGTWDGAGDQRAFTGAVVEDTDATSITSIDNAQALTIGATNVGGSLSTITITMMVFTSSIVSQNAIDSLAAYCTARFGV